VEGVLTISRTSNTDVDTVQGFDSNSGTTPDPDMMKTLMEEIVRLKAKLGDP
jgi:hypothetical protein